MDANQQEEVLHRDSGKIKAFLAGYHSRDSEIEKLVEVLRELMRNMILSEGKEPTRHYNIQSQRSPETIHHNQKNCNRMNNEPAFLIKKLRITDPMGYAAFSANKFWQLTKRVMVCRDGIAGATMQAALKDLASFVNQIGHFYMQTK